MNMHYPYFISSKMMRNIFAVLLVAITLWACSDDDKPKGKFEHGAFIVNEGNFGSGNGTVSWYDEGNDVTDENIYKNAAGQYAGDVAQSITFNGDKAYIVLNGDNKIEIADANTFERLGSITNDQIVQPRYVQVIDNKAYVTVQGPYDDNYNLVDSYVLVINLSDNSVIKKIPTDEGIEHIVRVGNYLFASNYNYGGSNTVAVIDPTNNTLVTQVEVTSGPSGMVVDSNNKLWVICQGGATSKLVRLNTTTFEVEQTIDLGVSADQDLAITPDKSGLVYISNSSVYKMSTSATTAPAAPFFTIDALVYEYALDVNPNNGEIWVGDALNFTAQGKVYIYNSDGTPKTTVTAGISPTNFAFK